MFGCMGQVSQTRQHTHLWAKGLWKGNEHSTYAAMVLHAKFTLLGMCQANSNLSLELKLWSTGELDINYCKVK